MTHGDEKRLKTIERAFDILEYLMEADGMRLTELADTLDMAPSTAHGYLSTLQSRGYVTKERNEYHVGLNILEMGNYVRRRKKPYRMAKTYTKKVSDATGYRSLFATQEQGRAVLLHVHRDDHPNWDHAHIGHRFYLHNTAVGKVLLAELPDEKIEAALDRWGMPKQTEYTITDREELFRELEEIRERGYSFNDEENIRGLRAIGAAVNDPDGGTIGALSVSGAVASLSGERFEREIPEQVLTIVNEFELDVSLTND